MAVYLIVDPATWISCLVTTGDGSGVGDACGRACCVPGVGLGCWPGNCPCRPCPGAWKS